MNLTRPKNLDVKLFCRFELTILNSLFDNLWNECASVEEAKQCI